jgi:transposase
MPEPYRLERVCSGGETIIKRGPYVVGRYEDDDVGLRNLVIVSLREMGHGGHEVACCFGLSVQYVSELRSRAKKSGSLGVVHEMGRPRKLTDAKMAKARAWAAQGVTNAEIARRVGVHPGTIWRLLGPGRPVGEAADQSQLELVGDSLAADSPAEAADTADADADGAVEVVESAMTPVDADVAFEASAGSVPPGGLGRIEEAEAPSRYAGAMLLYPFLERLGVAEVLAGLPAGPARRYDAAGLVLAATFGFALGISSLEGAKHLRVADAGALIGLESFPHLRSLRPRLASLADSCDPLAVQRSFAKAMLAGDERPPELFYIDDHFVTYWGARPVAKGYNIRRHLAEPGRDDTFVVDSNWRAICFASGEPRGLSISLPEVLGDLKQIVAGRPAMVGFDRGGSYPKVFQQIAEAGMDWVTWRRAPLATPTVEARRSWVNVAGKRKTLLLADEQITLDGYSAGPVRQLSAFENGKVAFQVLTSNTKLKGAPTVERLRGRWCIENTNKYLEDHHGVHWLASYQMDIEPDTTKVANPARRDQRARLHQAKTALADAERALGRQADTHVADVTAHLAALAACRDQVAIAKDDLAEAKAALKPIPAKLPANQIDPNAKRAKPALAARALQMVCRLLAYNAELDLARRLNVYLDDLDEYRAITRNLLHQGGHITYHQRDITVTLDRPDSPRITRALTLLLDEIAAGPPVHLTGDNRPITYQIARP